MSHRVAVPPLVAVARHCGLERHEFTLLLFFVHPPWNVSFLFHFHHSLLNLFSLSHSLMHSLLLAFLPPTTLCLCLSFPCSPTIIHPHFILSFWLPSCQSPFGLLSLNSLHAPFSPCAFITSFSLPITPFSIISSFRFCSFLLPFPPSSSFFHSQ